MVTPGGKPQGRLKQVIPAQIQVKPRLFGIAARKTVKIIQVAFVKFDKGGILIRD